MDWTLYRASLSSMDGETYAHCGGRFGGLGPCVLPCRRRGEEIEKELGDGASSGRS
jgi:hypothetical protein